MENVKSLIELLHLPLDRAGKLSDATGVIELCEDLLSGLPEGDENVFDRSWQTRKRIAGQLRKSEMDLVLDRLKLLQLKPDSEPAVSGRQYQRISGNQLPTKLLLNYAEELMQAIKAENDEPNFHSLSSKFLEKEGDIYLKILKAMIVDGYRRDDLIVFLEAAVKVRNINRHLETVPGGEGSLSTTQPPRQADKNAGVEPFLHHGPSVPQNGSPVSGNPVHAILRTLKASRILTLNYDVQFEREVLRHALLPDGFEATAFRNLCREAPTDREDPLQVSIESGRRKTALSSTLDSEGVGHLVSFAAFSSSYDTQIFHLHGRLDDPDNMVVTQKDYQRVYLGDVESERTFLEAQEVMFGGNDILFVGIGLTEDDVLRPLRRFVSRGNLPDQARRRLFALLPRNHKESSDESDDAREDTLKSIRHAVHYDIYTIYFGGSAYMKTMCLLDRLEKHLNDADAFENSTPSRNADFSNKWLRDLGVDAGRDAVDQLLDANEIETLEKVVQSLSKILGKSPDVDSTGNIEDTRLESKAAFVSLIDEFRNRLMSRALVIELEALSLDTAVWWKQWRELPVERKAIYSARKNSAGETGNGESPGSETQLVVRHQPEYVNPIVDAEEIEWSMIKDIKDKVANANKNRHYSGIELKGNQRILRLHIPRGGGKGSLVHLMSIRTQRSQLFASGPPVASTSSEDYPAFIAHLSFSMEFNSVLRALSRFLAQQIVNLQTQGIRNLIKSTEDINEFLKQHDEAPKEDEKSNDDLSKALRAVLELYRTLRNEPVGDPVTIPSRKDCFLLALELYCKSRKEEPAMALLPETSRRRDYKPSNGHEIPAMEGPNPRPHRLDILAGLLGQYQSLAQPGERLFVCLSGLDRICDVDGDAFNPMHRAFFRLMTGDHRTSLQSPRPPIDLVLISGREDAPIAYLSERLASKKRKSLKTGDYKYYGRRSKTGSWFRKWLQPAPFSLFDRFFLTPFARKLGSRKTFVALVSNFGSVEQSFAVEHPLRLCAALLAAELLQTSQHMAIRPPGDPSIRRALLTTMQHNAWLNVMIISQWLNDCEGCIAARDKRSNVELLETRKRSLYMYLDELDGAAAARGHVGVLAVVLKRYKALDTGIGTDSDDSPQNCKRLSPHLFDGIMRHLSLFSVPIEIGVLHGCPEVAKLLYGAIADEHEQSVSASQVVRTKALELLEHHLKVLTERDLVIPVAPSSFGQTSSDRVFQTLNRRYSLHSRLREYLSEQMQLSLLDHGESNHHQLSIYCDQPKDLPTPSIQHYGMVSRILDEHIEEVAGILRVFYYLKECDFRQSEQDGDCASSPEDALRRKRYLEEAATLIFAGEGRACVLGTSLGRIQAMPQILRGSYSLLRGAFSVGAISRLDTLYVDDDNKKPYETYRGWLRSLMNLAVGLQQNQEEIKGILEEWFLPSETAENGVMAEQKQKETLLQELKKRPRFAPQSNEQFDDETEIRVERFIRCGKEISEKARALGIEFRQHVYDGAANGTDDKKDGIRVRHPFYRDEIAWLYNERGLTSLIQGRVFDALPMFDQARLVVAHAQTPDDDPYAHHATERRIVLNKSIALIDRGEIGNARSELEWLRASSEDIKGSTPEPLLTFAVGYLAVCDHLSGSLERAESGYKTALKVVVDKRMLRMVAIMNRHLSDLYRAQRKLDEALHCARLAVNAASQAEQRDVQHLSLVSEARVLIDMGDAIPEANSRIRRALSYANRMGLYRLRVDAQLAHSQLMLDNGEFGLAGTAAAQAAALATRHGLKLRKLSALWLYASTQVKRENETLAAEILLDIKAEAESIGYQTHAAKSSDLLAQLEPSIGPVEEFRRRG